MAGLVRLLFVVGAGLAAGCSAMRTEVAVTYQSGDCAVTARAWR